MSRVRAFAPRLAALIAATFVFAACEVRRGADAIENPTPGSADGAADHVHAAHLREHAVRIGDFAIIPAVIQATAPRVRLRSPTSEPIRTAWKSRMPGGGGALHRGSDPGRRVIWEADLEPGHATRRWIRLPATRFAARGPALWLRRPASSRAAWWGAPQQFRSPGVCDIQRKNLTVITAHNRAVPPSFIISPPIRWSSSAESLPGSRPGDRPDRRLPGKDKEGTQQTRGQRQQEQIKHLDWHAGRRSGRHAAQRRATTSARPIAPWSRAPRRARSGRSARPS